MMDAVNKVLGAVRKRNVAYKTDESFQQLTTFGTGGNVALTVYPANVRQLTWLAQLLARVKAPHVFVGNGSNILAGDGFYNGVAVVTKGVNQVFTDGQYVTAQCGANTASVAAELVKNGLGGGEFFGCIPATVGGAVACNAGCYEQSVSQVLGGGGGR